MKQFIALIGISICFAFVVIAKDAQPNEDPQIEQRMKALTEQLRCLVCQNETLADSRADLAEDLRQQIREQMKAGKSDQEILAFLTERYARGGKVTRACIREECGYKQEILPTVVA